MHFEIASACMKRILYWGQGGVCKPITSVIPVATQFRLFLFCFDKLLPLTFLQLLKKKWPCCRRALGYFGLSWRVICTKVNFQVCLILIKTNTLANVTSVMVLEATPNAQGRLQVCAFVDFCPAILNSDNTSSSPLCL